MFPCPICETPNPPGSRECATCGKVFVTVAVGDVPAGGLAELELARIDSSSIPAGVSELNELDTGRAVPVNVVDDKTPDLDLARAAPVAVAADQTPDMEQTAIAEKEWTPLTDGPVVCRACGTPQTDITSPMCGNCGRKLPVVAPTQGVILDAEPVSTKPPERVRCFSCGSKVFPAELCTDCGIPLKLRA